MKILSLIILMMSGAASAQISLTLSASLGAAKMASPTLYKNVSSQLLKVKSGCDLARNSLLTEEHSERMIVEMTAALDYEIAKIDSAFAFESSCLSNIFTLNLAEYSRDEGVEYLQSVKRDIKSQNYQSCSVKLAALLKEAQDEN